MQRRHVYHLVPPAVWDGVVEPTYSAASLVKEGFIHCSNADQVAASANRFYSSHDALLVLEIDVEHLQSPLRDEPSTSGELFPHVYGPIERDAVVRVHSLRRGSDGRWTF
jgi:uncharacterized protein (DUF952 family)